MLIKLTKKSVKQYYIKHAMNEKLCDKIWLAQLWLTHNLGYYFKYQIIEIYQHIDIKFWLIKSSELN